MSEWNNERKMEEASSGFVLNYFDILSVCSSFYRDFLKLTKEESFQNGSRYRANEFVCSCLSDQARTCVLGYAYSLLADESNYGWNPLV